METKLKEMIKSFESSSKYINELSTNLNSFTSILTDVKIQLEPIKDIKNQITPLNEIKNFLNDSTIFSNLENLSRESKLISGNIKDIDKYISTIDSLSENYSSNVRKTLTSLKSIELLINNYNKEVSPYIDKILIEIQKFNDVNLENIVSDYREKLAKINLNISTFTALTKDGIVNINEEISNFKNENKNLDMYYSKISTDFSDLLEKQKLYSDQLSKLLKFHSDLNITVETIKGKDDQAIDYFKNLCNLWASENIRKMALTKNNNIVRKMISFVFILLLLLSLFLNFDFYINGSRNLDKIFNKSINSKTEINTNLESISNEY